MDDDYDLTARKFYRPKRNLHYNTEINLGIHENHEWEVVTDVPSPHSGKIICKSCGDKWITWLPKGAI